MNIQVNGQARDVPAMTVAELLTAEGARTDIACLAVALNDAVVPRRHWGRHSLAAGDRVEIVQPVQGG